MIFGCIFIRQEYALGAIYCLPFSRCGLSRVSACSGYLTQDVALLVAQHGGKFWSGKFWSENKSLADGRFLITLQRLHPFASLLFFLSSSV